MEEKSSDEAVISSETETNLIGGADIDLELMTSDIHVYANGSP